ncbi:hypothetical protein BPLS_P2708 [Bathymodiolus platifrons methanotrophic gill symbiont]|uniref:DUF1566 domain-containing protein n=1 Tax=Bathymodiolus platifrons methanotrophic gill symbiont TaxID=113268 RepID=UPI001B757458|nr:DUF1566 domain-containing protein [Bathymodiolus platifrons methanotrophic gill symbiont]GFO75467.1 hypothetical protein BPLS_P2708 [Bathymodiolus platifrons methanotrophic gill symbiont]
MNIKIIATLLMIVWVTTASAYGWEDGDPLILSGNGDEAKVEYELSCDEQRLRDPSMSDDEYSDFLLEFQDSECATVFKVGDIGFGGGKVFYVTDEGRHGMEIAPNHHTTVEYGCWNVALEGARYLSMGAGASNTDVALENKCNSYYGGSSAIDVLRNYDSGGVKDWYIPSMRELEEIYSALGAYTVTEKGDAHPSFPKFFWSSSEAAESWMYGFNLTNGTKAKAHKIVKLSLLLIRNF